MVSRGNAATRVRQRPGTGNRRGGEGKTLGQHQPLSRRSATPLTSSNALFSMGPYTYIVRQPARMELTGESRCRAVGDGEGQRHLGSKRRSADGQRQTQERDQDEEAPLWISPVVAPRQGEATGLVGGCETPDTFAFSPPPPSPWPLGANEGKRCDNGTTTQEQERASTPLNTPPQRESNVAAASATLLSELLRRVQKRREAGVHSSSPAAQHKAAEAAREAWTSPQPQRRQKEESHHRLHQREKQRRMQRGCSLASRLYGDIEEQRSSPDRRAARHRRNEALRFIGIDAGREEGIFTDSNVTSSATPPTVHCASLDTLEWGNQLWSGIKEDEERFCRWVAQRGLFQRENAVALRVFTEYLKKKADRLERDCDALFWSSRQRPTPNPQQEEERLHRHGRSPRGPATSTGQLRSATLGVEGAPGAHAYSIETEAAAGRGLRAAAAAGQTPTPGTARREACRAEDGELCRERPIPPTSRCRGGAEKSTPLAASLRRRRRPAKMLHNCSTPCDASFFYTGHSLAAAEEEETWSRGDAERSSSLAASLHSSPREQTTTRPERHRQTDRSTSPPPPQQQRRQDRNVKHGVAEKEESAPAIVEQGLGTLSVNEATSTAAPAAYCTSRLPAESHVSAFVPRNTFFPPSVAGIEDVSTVIRLRNYCGQLDEEFMRLLREGEAQGHCCDAASDTPATAAGATKRKPAHPVSRMGATTAGAMDRSSHRPALFSPPPPPNSLPTASALLAWPQHAPETAGDDNGLTQFNVSSVSYPSYGGRSSLRTTHHGEPRNECGSEQAVDYKAPPISRRNVCEGAPTPPVSLILSASSLEDERHGGGVQGGMSPPVSFVASRHISPMPHELRTVTPSGDLKEMEHVRSLVASRVPSVNQSMQHDTSLRSGANLPCEARKLRPRDANTSYAASECTHDAAVQRSPPMSRGNVLEPVPTASPGAKCQHLVEPVAAPGQIGGRLTATPILDKNVTPAEDIGGSVDSHEAAAFSPNAHGTTAPLDSSSRNRTGEVPQLVTHKSFSLRAEGDSEATSVNSLHTRRKRTGCRQKNRGPGNVAWSGSSSSGSSSSGSSGETVCGVDMKKQGLLPQTPNGRDRFGLLMSGSALAAATPVAQSSSSLELNGRVDSHIAKTRDKIDGPTSLVVREGGGFSVVHVAGSNQSTPHKSPNPFFVGVMNPGGGNVNGRKVAERLDGGTGAPRSRRFGVSKETH
ncbi:uncharacterized protein Tco025E_06061 [Trypanosoma conorhini]|uniref:Uncharacterized protein n=1 Tax=Trypanosoma conorhini TaxID=83891 RepID=A0A3R7NY31_9TRYP|nr:uncharacterized protein Tco025E_06061 [Trypanosoma conorhini]RNF13748.1 hypothetical protein Tco025E_06061 [Trypanosoma conorhini]